MGVGSLQAPFPLALVRRHGGRVPCLSACSAQRACIRCLHPIAFPCPDEETKTDRGIVDWPPIGLSACLSVTDRQIASCAGTNTPTSNCGPQTTFLPVDLMRTSLRHSISPPDDGNHQQHLLWRDGTGNICSETDWRPNWYDDVSTMPASPLLPSRKTTRSVQVTRESNLGNLCGDTQGLCRVKFS